MTVNDILRANADVPRVLQADPPWPIRLLWGARAEPSAAGERGGLLPDELAARYAAPLSIALRADRPTVVANFVSTLDGVVALDQNGASSGREISGGFEPDRFLMGLLRATADAVVVGAGTVRASRTHGWTPGHAHPASAGAYADWRRALGLDAADPATVIVTASGSLEPRHIPDPGSEVVVVTTDAGARHLARLPRAAHVDIVSLGVMDAIPAETLLAFLESRGYRLVLSEGGPSIFGQLLAARLVDEVFLTLAPQLAGRGPAVDRLSLVEGAALGSGAAWARLQSVLRSDDHLFVRYRFPSRSRKELS